MIACLIKFLYSKIVLFQNEACTIDSESEVKCRTPPYVKSDFERRKRAIGQTVYVNFDNYRSPSTIYYVEDPTFSKLSNVLEYEEGKEGEPIVIQVCI